jgi:AcrR family transcriptional regulator
VASPTRDRLLDAGLESFATRGVDGTPITDLEHDAGLAAGSGGFYRYFKTKDELLEAVVRREVERASARRSLVASPDGATPRQAIEHALRSMLAVVREQRMLIRVLARHPSRGRVLAPLVEAGLLDAGIRHDAAQLAAVSDHPDPEELRVRVGVVVVALVGHILTTDYFGHPAAGLSDDEVVRTLAELIDDRRHPSSEG